MELEEANNDLHAMRLLYRLLEDNSIALLNNNSEELVERARVLLKTMLDVAAERVVETHLKKIETQAGVCNTPCTSQPEKFVSSQQLRPVKHQPCEDDQPQRLSKSSISDNKGTNRNKLSSLSEESSMMRQNLVKATKLFKERAILPDKDIGHHKQHDKNLNTSHGGEWHANEPPETSEDNAGESTVASEDPLLNKIDETQCNPSAACQVGPQDNEIDLSNDLVNAVKRIESCILALQLCSNLVPSSKESASHRSMNNSANTDSPVTQRKDGIIRSQLSSGRSPLDVNELRNPKASLITRRNENLTSRNEFEELPVSTEDKSLSHVASQNVRLRSIGTSRDICSQKGGGVCRVPQLVPRHEELLSENRIKPSSQDIALVDKVRSLNRSMNGNDHLVSKANECIQGFRVPLCQHNLVKSPSMLTDHQTNKEYPIRNPNIQVETDRKAMRREPSKPPKLMGHSKTIITRRDKKPPYQMVIRPTLLDQKSGVIRVLPGFHRDKMAVDRKGTHEASHFDTQKTRVIPRHSVLEESSSASNSNARWTDQQSSATSSSDSEDYSLPGSMPAHEYMAPSSRRIADMEYGSSEESSVSYKDVGPSYRTGSLRSYRSLHKRSLTKSVGRLRRIKNKLGLIFHHHHHHHHYHHDGDDSKIGHQHSMWNNLQKIFPHKTEHEQLGKQKVEKSRRKTVARVTHRNQAGKFHGMVAGALRHIRHSRKPKTSKVVRNAPPGCGKKLHWWQMIKKRRQGVKLINRNRLKMRFKSQKSFKN